jgi:protein-disulfide isomerase
MSETRTPFLQSRVAYLAIGAIGALLATAAVLITQNLTTGGPAGINKAATEKIVHDYILANPEILPEAIKRLEANSMADGINANRKAIEKPYAGSWEGNPNGDVTLVEFFDYACGYCRASLSDIARLVAEDKNLKVVYREYPVLSEDSGLAARVSLLAAQQGKYMAFHRAMYAAGGVSKDKILAAAARAGLDSKAAAAALADPSLDAEISNNAGLAQSLKAAGTPLFVIGNQVINTTPGFDGLKAAVAKARAEG